MLRTTTLAAIGAALGLMQTAQAIDPPASGNPQRDAFYGELHLHTNLSMDAYIFFNAKLGPDMAYRFARGEAVPYLGQMIRRKEPLDFMAVTDHAENVGVYNSLDDPASPLSKSEFGQRFRKVGAEAFWATVDGIKTAVRVVFDFDPAPLTQSAWQQEIDAANRNYQPGKFTTFIGYEWTSSPDGMNLHRNVIFRGDTAPYPFTALDSKKPEDLWRHLDGVRKQGVEALAISHNGNASNGLMYDWAGSDGKPIDEAYALLRVMNEPLAEIHQNKGQSEVHPALSPNDEFAGFELYDHFLVGNTKSAPPGSYLRDAWGRGLVIGQRAGVNPYKIGVAGGTDFHNGLSTSAEDATDGTMRGTDLKLDIKHESLSGTNDEEHGANGELLDTNSGGLTGVWAEHNSRESIYDAMRRKETFATSGTRLKFRFFGSWNFQHALMGSSDWVKTAYTLGVPMGGDLPARGSGAGAPRFAVWAVKDSSGANLDRIQIVKLWLKDGKYAEKVFDVAYAGKRRPNPKTGKLPAIGNTVDLKTATYRNNIGAVQLASVWKDPQFDPDLPAVYYLRVLEIPTPRWSTLLAVRRGKPNPDGVAATIQERGWSSPIWYTPSRH